jgi:hypothetical protein
MTTEITILGLDEIEIQNTSIEEIDAEEVTLMFVGIDQSGSMDSYTNDMLECLKNFKDALADSKEADSILLVRANFDSRVDIPGYKRIGEFDTHYRAAGSTAMYDCIVEGVEKMLEYRHYLKTAGHRVKAVFSIFSDGEDNVSSNNISVAKNKIDKLNKEEIVTAFISFGGGDSTAKSLGFQNMLTTAANASELRKSFDCLSKSLIETSKNIVTPGTTNFFQM